MAAPGGQDILVVDRQLAKLSGSLSPLEGSAMVWKPHVENSRLCTAHILTAQGLVEVDVPQMSAVEHASRKKIAEPDAAAALLSALPAGNSSEQPQPLASQAVVEQCALAIAAMSGLVEDDAQAQSTATVPTEPFPGASVDRPDDANISPSPRHRSKRFAAGRTTFTGGEGEAEAVRNREFGVVSSQPRYHTWNASSEPPQYGQPPGAAAAALVLAVPMAAGALPNATSWPAGPGYATVPTSATTAPPQLASPCAISCSKIGNVC